MSDANVSHDALLTLLGTAAGMTLAAVSAFAWLISFLMRIDQRQTDARHKDRSEMTGHVANVEHDLTRRIERLEETSLGLALLRRHQAGDGHDGD